MNTTYDLDPAALSAEERVSAIVAAEREIARLQARQVRLIAALADDSCADSPAPELDRQWMREELRAALGESTVRVGDRIEFARALVDRLPATLTALEAGVLTARHARCLAEAVNPLSDENVARVEAQTLDFATRSDLAGFTRKVRREVLKCDHRSAEDRFAAALADRRVWSQHERDGMVNFGALLPAVGGQAVWTALDLVASEAGSDDLRTADQRRADALVQLAVDALNGYYGCPHCRHRDGDVPKSVAENDNVERATQPRWQGMRPSVQVTVALSTLLGIDEQPGELDGYGPIPATLARRMAADPSGTWRRLVTDKRGRLLDYGRTTYRPPADLRDYVLARDRECMFPTCHRRACRCDIDHIRPWEDGGETNPDNLVVLCCRHHHGKHDAGWSLRRLSDDTIEWTSPLGRVYVVPASTYPIDTTFDCVVPHDNNETLPTPTDRAA